jgi:hypothetical protein
MDTQEKEEDTRHNWTDHIRRPKSERYIKQMHKNKPEGRMDPAEPLKRWAYQQ